jgi:hypothetical protein
MSPAPPSRAEKVFAVTALMLLASFTALLFSAPRAQAITYVRGPISSDTTWGIADTTYIVVGHVTVLPGVQLSILPGTTVRFNAGIGLWVEGALLADGIPGNPIQFLLNSTLLPVTWRGIQFNATATGSVTNSVFDRSDVAVAADGSSPFVADNLVQWAGFFGFYLANSDTVLSGNTVLRAGVVGIYAFGGAPQILSNVVNGTTVGIEVEGTSWPIIASNTVTNVTGTFALGIYTLPGVTPQIWGNIVAGVVGSRGPNGGFPGSDGGFGGIAIGILVSGAPWAGVWSNAIDAVAGGRGGNGRENLGGQGGAGGPGGPAGGVIHTGTLEVDSSGNVVSNVVGGRGGDGGGGGGTSRGGKGGDGGYATAVQTFDAMTSAAWIGFTIDDVTGGPGGDGGSGTASVGAGGAGGDAYGIFGWNTRGNATWNWVGTITGGLGGNSTAAASGRSAGGAGGDAIGVIFNFLSGEGSIRENGLSGISGGQGGRGASGGPGGNATGALSFGTGIGGFNLTTASSNWFEFLTGGEGGVGDSIGGQGGSATAVAAANVQLVLSGNGAWTLTGGNGGDGTSAGRGGDAAGLIAVRVPKGTSTNEWLAIVSGGAPGVGVAPPPSFGAGFYAVGSPAIRTELTIENATILSTSDFDLAVDNYANATTISTDFDGGRVEIGTAGNLTVRNYLAVNVYWPDGFTLVPGARIRVRDNAVYPFDFVTPTGQASWLLVTDRIYINSNTATENVTEVEVSYLAFAFLNNPRHVAMPSDVTEDFVMDDKEAPSSAAGVLPAYTRSWTFNVSYTASDGNGTGLRNITLWYRLNGTGGWIAFATQPAGASGVFTFSATADGTYEFATTADDNAGNVEPGPGANDTWTIVDTVAPGSHVVLLPTYTNTSSFTVSWEPDPGVTDIATYTIQYRRNGGPWTDWLVGTTLTGATFPADPPSGTYEFRSLATDAAGNVEVPPTVNDTWTIVDIVAPLSSVRPLGTYQASLNFTVTWGPDFDTTDIASYRIEVRDDGGPWTVWIASTTATSSIFGGVDGHLYAFRSIATDRAGNVEPVPAGNDTWTIVDVTPPTSAVAALPLYTIATTVAVSWGPTGGTTDIATYTLEVSDNGGAWTAVPGYVGTTLTSGSFTGVDGHRYAFRSIATDRAGNVEPAPAGNDTWTIVDATGPTSSHSLSGPVGANGWYLGSVSVTLTASDATSGILSLSYRVDGGSWTSYTAPFTVSGDGSHTVDYFAVDNAGWTETVRTASVSIDTAPPATSAALSGTTGTNGWWRSSVVVTLTPTDGASGVASTSYRIDGGAWQTYTAPFVVSGDGGHVVAYASTDRAGNVGTTASTTIDIDSVAPTVTTSTPRGANVNTTPAIVITFNEPMNRSSVELAFSLSPDMNGAFSWSADSRTLTFTPARALDPGTTYVVFLDTRARDAAGNPLGATYSFAFATVAAPAGFALGDSWWILALIGALAGGALFVVARRRAAASAKPAPTPVAAAKKDSVSTIDDVFLLYRDGVLIKHETRRLKPDIDTDILSGMLTAVQQFVKDSFRSEEGELDELTFGQMHILIGRGKWVILAAMIQGEGTDAMMEQVKRCVGDMEEHAWDQLDGWDGDMVLARALSPYIKKLVRGEYA